MKKIILLGNPNCGKTTLFNTLTKSHAITGNRLGVTVEAKSGIYKNGDTVCEIIDLPGVFSLSPFTNEEKVVSEYIKNARYDTTVCVIDSLNPTRGLALASSLFKLKKPLVLAFNFCDMLKKEKAYLDIKKAEEIFGTKCIQISASKGTGIHELVSAALSATSAPLAKTLPSPEQTEKCILKHGENFSVTKYHKPDKILLKGNLSFVFLLIAAGLMFFLTFSGMTAKLSTELDGFITRFLCEKMRIFLNSVSNPLFSSLICDGIIKGCGTVVGFLPQITVLTMMLAIFEDSGYLSRSAYILDGIFGKFGLQGKCFFCLMSGFGCSVPAILSSRILENKQDRLKTILLIPFIPCSAKLPLLVMISSLFFNSNAMFVPLLYILTCTVGITLIFFISKVGKKERNLFLLELPPYRIPSIKSMRYSVITRLKDFLTKAGTVLVIGNTVIWFLTNFDISLNFVTDSDESMLYLIGKALLPIFKHLGFCDWRQTVSMFSGLIARESIVSSLKILYNSGTLLAASFTKPSALAFCTFSLLFPPCIGTLGTMYKETKSIKILLGSILLQSVTAYTVSFTVYNIGRLIF